MIENNILYSKQFCFQNSHSTGHAVVQLVDQIIESFENNKYTLGVFIDLSKAFDTVDYSIPIDTGRKLNVLKASRRRPGCLLNVLCTFNLRPLSTGILLKKLELYGTNHGWVKS